MKSIYLVPLVIILLASLVFAGCASPAPTTTQPPAQTTTAAPTATTAKPTSSAPTTTAAKPSTTAAPHAKVAVTMVGSPMGSDGQNFLIALADIMGKNHPWLTAPAQEGLGSTGNYKVLSEAPADKKKLMAIQAIDAVSIQAYLGIGPFQATGANKDWKFLLTLYTAGTSFMTLNSNIKSGQDLVGKKLGVTPKGHGMTAGADFAVNKCWELKDKINIVNMPQEMLKDALLDGTVDAIISGGMYFSESEFKVSPYAEQILAAKSNVYYIGVTEAEFKTGLKNEPTTGFIWGKVKANSLKQGYPAADSGILRGPMGLVVSPTMEDEIAYEFVKTTYANGGKFVDYFAAGKAFTPAVMVQNIWKESQYHPAALKFYKEKGLAITGSQP